MTTVDLLRCNRCGLKFVMESDEIPFKCPRCWGHSGIPSEVIVMGRDVRVRYLREYGLEAGLADPKVRRGLEGLNLGHCEHGYISRAICPLCK